jgi:hypothetical protein
MKMPVKKQVETLERKAARDGRQLIVIIDRKYVCVGTLGKEFETLSKDDLAELKARRGAEMLVVRMEDEPDKL